MTNGRFRIMLAHHRGPYKTSFVIAVLVMLALFVFFPPFEFKPYELQAEPDIVIVDVVPDIDIPPPPKEEPVPIPEPDPLGEDVEMQPTTYEDPSQLPLPPRLDPTGPKPIVLFDELPEPEHIAKPVYPRMAREAGFEGTVQLKVLIGLNHKVRQAVVISSDVTPEMEKAAIEAALKCRYKPAKQQGVEVEVWVSIRINFRLN